MTIVTFTTDFGAIDYYVGVLKGTILSQNHTLNLVDITHNVPAFDIVEAAFIIKNAYKSFPKGSIHIVNVNNFNALEQNFIVIYHNGHYFLGPDNGLFSLVFDILPTEIYHLPTISAERLSVEKTYANAVRQLAAGLPLSNIGRLATQIQTRITLQPVVSAAQIRGSVIHIDSYENVIVNIREVLFEQVAGGRAFELYFKRYDPITHICTHYSEVEIGETLCIFNTAGYLEIAVNLGKAASLHNLKIDDTVQIDFI